MRKQISPLAKPPNRYRRLIVFAYANTVYRNP